MFVNPEMFFYLDSFPSLEKFINFPNGNEIINKTMGDSVIKTKHQKLSINLA